MDCPICGYKPKEVVVGQCPICHADVAMAVEQLSDPVPRAPAAKGPPARPKASHRDAGLHGLKWGVMLAIPLGLIGAIGMWAAFSGNVGTTGAVSGFEFGALLGFLIGSIWGVSSTLELGPGTAAVYGTVIGGVVTLVNYFIEATLVAVPDQGAHMYALMGCGAGAVAGWACMMLKEFRDER